MSITVSFSMNILIVINNLGVGGVQKMARYVCQSLSATHNCEILGLFSRRSIISTDSIFQLCPSKTPYSKILLRLHSFIKNKRPDIVIAFGSSAVVMSYLASRGLKVKIIGSERNDPQHLSWLWRTATRFIYPRCDGFAFQLEEVMSYYGMETNNTVQVIHNAYLGKQYDAYVKASERRKDISCSSARIDTQKGLDILLKAFSIVHEEHPDYHLSIYGKLSNWEDLKILITNLNIGKFINFKGQTDCLADSIHASRCFVLPSRFEGIPNALIEAMASGVPTVSCDCPPGGPRMLTKNGDSGLLCKVEDFVGMADCINRLIEDDTLCDTLSMKGQTVQDRFNAELISKKWESLCESIFF